MEGGSHPMATPRGKLNKLQIQNQYSKSKTKIGFKN